MKIAVIGSGAIGCLFGGYLSQQHEVVFITHTESTAQIINRDGVQITTRDGETTTYANVRAYANGTYDDPVDLVIFIVKTTQSRDALEVNRALVHRARMVITLQNGGGNEDVLAEYVAPEKILLAVTRNNCVNLGNGCIRRSNDASTLVGTIDGSVQDVAQVQQALVAAGLKADVCDDIRRAIWDKLFGNIAGNSFSALTDLPLGSLVGTEHSWNYAQLIIREAVAVACAKGVVFDADEVLGGLRQALSRSTGAIPSMCQDVRNRRLTEIEALNGYVVREGRRLGVPTPNNAFVVNLIHAIEENY